MFEFFFHEKLPSRMHDAKVLNNLKLSIYLEECQILSVGRLDVTDIPWIKGVKFTKINSVLDKQTNEILQGMSDPLICASYFPMIHHV